MKNGNSFSKPYSLGNDESQDRWKTKKSDSNVKNSNTLSLNIVAYENPDKYALDSLFDKNQVSTKNSFKNRVGFGKKLKDVKQFFNGASASIQDSFEFPRQSNGDEVEPEIMQFKASQRLLNPNNDKYKAVIDYACTLGMDDESLTLLYMVLAKKEQEAGGRNKSGDWNMLADLICNKKAFQSYAEKLIEVYIREDAAKIVKGCLEIQKLMDQNGGSNNSLSFIQRNYHLVFYLCAPLSTMWKDISPYGRKIVFQSTFRWASNFSSAVAAIGEKEIVKRITTFAKENKVFSIILASIPVTFEIVRSVWLWCEGKISGKRALQNITNVALTTAAGLVGAFGVAAIGRYFGVPANVGAFGGGLLGGFAGNQWLTNNIFDLPKTQALENAYQYLGVHHRASVSEVEKAYKRRLLIDHPDKGGSNEAFCKLQTCYAIIRIDRGKK